jgi:hypothetical protein
VQKESHAFGRKILAVIRTLIIVVPTIKPFRNTLSDFFFHIFLRKQSAVFLFCRVGPRTVKHAAKHLGHNEEKLEAQTGR